MADYQKMYYVLMDGVQRAISILEEEQPGTASEMTKKKLIESCLACEEIYIQTCDDPTWLSLWESCHRR